MFNMSTSPVTNGNGGTEQKIRQQEEQVRIRSRSGRASVDGEMVHAGARAGPCAPRCEGATNPCARHALQARVSTPPIGVASLVRWPPSDWRAKCSSGLRRAHAVAFCVRARRRVCSRPRRSC
jgi:hypothetical protein